MAASPAGRRLTEAHRLAQHRIGSAVALQVGTAFRATVNPADAKATFPTFAALAVPLVQAGNTTSSRLAGGYVVAFSTLETDDPGPAPAPSAGVNLSAYSVSMLVCGLVSLTNNLARNVSPDDAIDIAAGRTAAASLRSALDGGRDTILSTLQSDDRALGYERVGGGKTCDFCQSIIDEGLQSKDEGALDFQAHDGCSCGAQPVYG